MIETNKIYNEDCLDTMARIKDDEIDLVVTSPPYNMRTRIRNGKYTEREKADHFSKKYKHFHDAYSIEEYFEIHKKVISECLRISKVVCYNFQLVTGSKEAYFRLMGHFSEHIKDMMIWDKGSGQPAMHPKVLNACYEIVLILESDGMKGRAIQNGNFNRGELDNILRIGRGKRVSEIHGAVFPMELPKILIESFCKEGEIVYDPFMGSGTTAIVAQKLDRKWIGSEIIGEYVTLANERIQSELGIFS